MSDDTADPGHPRDPGHTGSITGAVSADRGDRPPAAVLVALSDRQGRLLVRGPAGVTTAAAATWTFPGGAVAPGEPPVDAARRHLTEQTGLAPTAIPALTRLCRVPSETDGPVVVLGATDPAGDVGRTHGSARDDGRPSAFLDPRVLPTLPLTQEAVLALPQVLTSAGYVAAHGRVPPRGFAGVLLLDRDDRILLQERDEHAAIDPERWGLPGGHLEEGEDPRSGALRELAEETGLHLSEDEVEHLATIPVYHPHRSAVDTMAVFLGRTEATDEALVCGEGRQVAFVEPDLVDGLDLTFSARTVLPAFLAGRHRRTPR